MSRVELKHIPVRPSNPFAGWQYRLQNALLVLFLLSVLLIWVRIRVPSAAMGQTGWPDALLLVLAAGSTLISLCGQVPSQNAIFAAVAIGCAGGVVDLVGAVLGIPFGPLVYNEANIGRMIFQSVPWPVPLIWVVLLLNSRGVARLMLRPYRTSSRYGFWVMGLTVLLVLLFDLGLEPYATVVKQYWSWKPTRISSDWYTAPWTNFLGWAVTTTLILLFVTPLLINKSPVKPSPSSHPLIIWESLSIVLLSGALFRHLANAAILTGVQMIVVAIVSLPGLKGKNSAPRRRKS